MNTILNAVFPIVATRSYSIWRLYVPAVTRKRTFVGLSALSNMIVKVGVQMVKGHPWIMGGVAILGMATALRVAVKVAVHRKLFSKTLYNVGVMLVSMSGVVVSIEEIIQVESTSGPLPKVKDAKKKKKEVSFVNEQTA